MAQITRAFEWHSYRFGRLTPDCPVVLLFEVYRLNASACGPLIKQEGFDDALGKLSSKLGVWLNVNFNNALLLDSADNAAHYRADDEASYLKHTTIGSATTAPLLAEYMLTSVCEPLFRHEGLLVTKLRLQQSVKDPVYASLPQELVDCYLADLEPRPDDPPPVLVQEGQSGLPPAGSSGMAATPGARHGRSSATYTQPPAR